MDEENYPDFIAYYRDNIDNEESYLPLLNMSRDYHAQDAKLDRKAGMRVEAPELKMDKIGGAKTYDAKPAKDALREEYKSKADKLARQHGFKGKSFNEHMEEQEILKTIPEHTDKKEVAKQINRQKFLNEISRITEKNRNQGKIPNI